MNMVVQIRHLPPLKFKACTNADGTPKMRYATRAEARAAAKHLSRYRDPVHAYACEKHGYHLGHAGGRPRQANPD
jgi:hypothetical protein